MKRKSNEVLDTNVKKPKTKHAREKTDISDKTSSIDIKSSSVVKHAKKKAKRGSSTSSTNMTEFLELHVLQSKCQRFEELKGRLQQEVRELGAKLGVNTEEYSDLDGVFEPLEEVYTEKQNEILENGRVEVQELLSQFKIRLEPIMASISAQMKSRKSYTVKLHYVLPILTVRGVVDVDKKINTRRNPAIKALFAAHIRTVFRGYKYRIATNVVAELLDYLCI